MPITIGGLSISSGDVIVGDPDGAIAIPRDGLDDVFRRAEDVVAAEEGLETRVSEGLVLPDFYRALRETGALRYVD